MSRALWEPRGADRVRKAMPKFSDRKAFDGEIAVSLCGDIRDVPAVRCPFTVYADPGRAYDWTALQWLPVVVVVRKGIDATPVVRALWDIADPFIQIHDADTGDEAAIVQIDPKLRLWHKRRDLEPVPEPDWKTANFDEKRAYFRTMLQGWGLQ